MNFNSIGTPADEPLVHIEIAKNCTKGIVELGVLKGQTTKILCQNSNVQVYGIDPLIPDSMNPSLIGSIEEIENNTRGFNFTFYKDFSYNVINFFDKPFDYLFIDASHIYEDVKRDFEQWFPKLSNGGFIGLHDSAANRGGPCWWPGPSGLADELINDNRLDYKRTIFSLTVFQKK